MADKTEPDLSEFEALSKPAKRDCPIGDALRGLPPAEKAKLEAALTAGKGRITGTAISQWLKARGHGGVNQQWVSSHRNETCSCSHGC